jgi:DnaJ-class molecular chaperone
MTYNLGPCSKCGGVGISLPKIRINPIKPIGLFNTSDNYCSKCGKSLVSRCFACNGTGRKMTFAYISRDRYCSECGRELDPPDDTCSSCDGTGEVRDTHHYCF